MTTAVVSGIINARAAGNPGENVANLRALSVLEVQTRGSAPPRVLSIGGAAAIEDQLPPRAYDAFLAGFIPLGGSASSGRFAVLKCTVGTGVSARTFYADWVPGSYQIPPCEAVTVQVVPYGGGWGQQDWTFVASVADGLLPSGHPLTYSGQVQLNPLASVIVNVPPFARSMEVEHPNPSGPNPKLLVHGAPGDPWWQPGVIRGDGAPLVPQGVFTVASRQVEFANLSATDTAGAFVRFYVAP